MWLAAGRALRRVVEGDVFAQRTEIAGHLSWKIADRRRAQLALVGSTELEVTPENLERLRALGYLS